MPFTIRGVDHTGITVTDLERSLAFWRDVLGFEVARRAHLTGEYAAQVTGVEGAEIELAHLVVPGHRIELLQYLRPTDREHFRPRSCDVGSVHVALLVDDIDAVLAEVAGAGWRAVGTPQVMPSGERAGMRFVYMRDPDGTTIELAQPATGA